MALKYALVSAMVALGLFAFAKRSFVIDAFHWDPKEPGIPVPAFDPVGRRKELATNAPSGGALVVADPGDTSQNGLLGVGGDTPEGVGLGGGTATLTGTVVSPGGGPVPGATVRVERFVGEQLGSLDITTNSNGAFSVANVPGGRYRVRAWQSPGLAQLESDVRFVADGDRQAFTLELTAPTGRNVDTDWSNSGWVIGGTPSISVSVTEPYVTSDGKVALAASNGVPVTLSVGGSLVGSAAGSTNADGVAAFGVRCAGVGGASASVTVGSYVKSLDVPICSPPPTTTTTTTTTTTVPRPPGAPPPAAPPGQTG